MTPLKVQRERLYTDVAQKFGNAIRTDLADRHRSHHKKNLNIISLIKSFELLKMPQSNPKKPSQVHRLYTGSHYQKQKKQIVQEFKQKLKHNLEESRLKKQERNQHLGNLARWKRNCMQVAKLNKMEELADRKKRDVKALKSTLGRFKQSLEQEKQQNQLQHTFKCFERRLNKYSSKSFSYSK